MLRARWIEAEPVSGEVETELARFGSVERQILVKRGVSTSEGADEFLGKNQHCDHDPFLMHGMRNAVKRINGTIERDEKVVIYGDYDVDGLAGTALLEGVLRGLGCRVEHYIPSRFSEGYGLNETAISAIAEGGGRLLISVDCGIRDADKVEYAAALNIDVIVTDHHEPGARLPRAVAVVDPRMDGDDYPFKDLAGVGVAYKLAEAVVRDRGGQLGHDLLDLVALGTIADVSKLQGENRRLVSAGIDEIRRTRRPGVAELMKIAHVPTESITASSIGFIIGPRLNAAGRLGSAERAFALLTTEDLGLAKDLAEELDAENRRRQDLTAKTVERAIEIGVEGSEVPLLIFAADEAFSEGVVGLAATRLVDRFYRPAFVAHRGGQVTRGSARSIPGFNVADALDACWDLLARHGGHESAGGFTLDNGLVEEFRRRLVKFAEVSLEGEDLEPVLDIDAVVEFAELGDGLLEFFELLEPCGEGNPAPVLMAKDVEVVDKRAVGSEGRHLKLALRQGGRVLDAIAFRRGEMARGLPQRVDVAFNFELNEYLGIRSKQLRVIDIRPASG